MLSNYSSLIFAEERFEYARRLKSAGCALAAAGVRIGRWRLRKRIAAARDDFELARRMRDRICDALMGIKEDNELCRLLEENGVSVSLLQVAIGQMGSILKRAKKASRWSKYSLRFI